jgi:hypothetical protein
MENGICLFDEFESIYEAKNEINEDGFGGSSGSRPANIMFVPGMSFAMDAQIFKLGKDKINTKSQEFQKAVEILKNLNDAHITIEGGASAVGSDSGFDNESLAIKRAKNLIAEFSKSGVNVTNYKATGKVGVNKIADSDEANKEQYVRIKYDKVGSISTSSAIDNTSMAQVIIPKTKSNEFDVGSINPRKVVFKILKVKYLEGDTNALFTEIKAINKKVSSKFYDVTPDYIKKKYEL